MHGFAGFIVGPGLDMGMTLFSHRWSGPEGAMVVGVRGGLLFGSTELAMEVGPHWFSFHQSDPNLEVNATIGHYFRLGGDVYWPLRGGAGFMALNLERHDVVFQGRGDLIGVAYNLGHLMIEANIPSLRVVTDFDKQVWFILNFGLGATYVF